VKRLGTDLLQTVAFRRQLERTMLIAATSEDPTITGAARESIRRVGEIIGSWAAWPGRPGPSPDQRARSATAAAVYLRLKRRHSTSRRQGAFDSAEVRKEISKKYRIPGEQLARALEAASLVASRSQEEQRVTRVEILKELIAQSPIYDFAQALERHQNQAQSGNPSTFPDRDK
jgi:hypothetical protein